MGGGQTIRLNSARGRRGYPVVLRRISHIDPQSGLWLIFLRNHFLLAALTMAATYRFRWRIELFFRWIKQHLRLRDFASTNPYGVRVQIWTTRCLPLLVAMAKWENALPESLHQISQIISIIALAQFPLPGLFANIDTINSHADIGMQQDINGS